MAKQISRRSILAGSGALAAGLSFSKISFAHSDKTLNFYNWDTYIGETTIEDFKKASDINVKMDLFGDNDELFAKLRNGNPGYDVIVPTHDYVEQMISADMLLPINKTKIPNFKNLDPQFQTSAYDPNHQYSIPYMWGTMGIGYRKSAVREADMNDWAAILESNKYSGRIAIISESSTMLRLVMKYLGYSMNSNNVDELKKATDLLIKQKPHFKVIADDNGQDLLLSGEVDIAVEWNGDILQIIEDDDDISYRVPKQGSLVWEDTLCIPKGAPNIAHAHEFINYLLDAKVGADIANFIYYATPNAAAKALMDKEYTENPAIFPTDETIKKLEYQLYLGQEFASKVEEEWTRFLSA